MTKHILYLIKIQFYLIRSLIISKIKISFEQFNTSCCMRTIKIFLLFIILATGFTFSAFSQQQGPGRGRPGRGGPGPAPIGAPLDGGLLTILGAGGIAYYVARKKSKKLES